MSAQKGAADFGRKLREARERRSLSLRQISNSTKISMLTLEALERNDVKRLPGGIFGRGVVRSYALEVGLDVESTIEEFMGQFPHESVTAGHPTTTQLEDHEKVESDRRMATAFLRLVLISVPVAAFVIYFATHGRRTASADVPRQEAPASATPPERPSESAQPAAASPAAANAVAPVP
jgi:cytoskeletal protein RodZ